MNRAVNNIFDGEESKATDDLEEERNNTKECEENFWKNSNKFFAS